MNNNYDMVIIGGGIIGASTAMQYLERNPRHTALLLEKESGPEYESSSSSDSD